jgi:hypothetical protein
MPHGKMSGQIFISYRREDNPAWARLVHNRLSQHFSQSEIFMDVDTIEPGIDFVEAIEESVGSCDVLIAMIGAHWLSAVDPQGGRRLDNPEDSVRLEIATALMRKIRVIPVLVDGAKMPVVRELPDDLRSLVRRNALELSHYRFQPDSERLIDAVERALEKATAERREREEKERLEVERRETEAKERLEAERRQKEEQEQLEAEQRQRQETERIAQRREHEEQERLETEQRVREERERLEQEPQSQPPSAVAPGAPSTSPAKPEADKPSAETPKVVYPLPPKPAEPEREKPRKSPSKQVIAFLAIAAVLVIGGLIYLAIRQSQLHLALQAATKDHPWVNSLGMKFVPVAGIQVLFSVWDTRVQDFEMFVKSTGYDATGGMASIGRDGWTQRGATWKEPGFSQGPNHPVVGVSWNDAEEFCKWLTKRERSAGDLPEDREYRLPKDEEWSAAMGLKNGEKLYPWDIPQKRDKSWPPPAGAGNYAGEEAKNEDWAAGWWVIEGYNDGYPRTSPVGSFEVNSSGLYDMGGNVRQWCEDWSNARKQYRVVRGASWRDADPVCLLASFRDDYARDARVAYVGFRCVVAVESSR